MTFDMRHTSKVMRAPKAPRGVIALISTLVIMAVVLAIGLSISLIGRDEIALSGVYLDGEQAFAIADACTEEGVSRFKANGAFGGTTLSLDGGSCTVTVTNLGGNTRLVRSVASYNDAIRVVEANVSLSLNAQGNAKSIRINSWREGD